MLQARILEAARSHGADALSDAWGICIYDVHVRLEGIVDLNVREAAAVAIMSGRPLSEFAL